MNLRLKRDEIGIIITDVQEKLLSVIKKKRYLCKNINLLLYMAKILNIPVIVTEHFSKGLGRTIDIIRNNLQTYKPIEKITFSSCATPIFMEELQRMGRKTVILCGVEAHICVYQTALDLIEKGYSVHVPQDAVASRSKGNWLVGLDLLRMANVALTSSEVIIFQVFERAGTEEFKAMTELLKERHVESYERRHPRRYYDSSIKKPSHLSPQYREHHRPPYRDSETPYRESEIPFDTDDGSDDTLPPYITEDPDEFRSVFGYDEDEGQ